MTDRIIYISRGCPYSKKLLIGIHKYDFLRSQFKIIDVSTQRYPDYIDSVPTLVVEQRMIKNDDVFSYMNNMVEQIFQQNPQLKEKYHPQQPQQPQQQQPQQQEQEIGQRPQKMSSPDYDPVDDIVGWCPGDG